MHTHDCIYERIIVLIRFDKIVAIAGDQLNFTRPFILKKRF